MKVAVIKIGARIIVGDKVGSSGASGEARSIINMLVEGGADVHCFTKILAKDPVPERVTMHQIEEDWDTVNEYDKLVIINGNANFFGGAEDRTQILNYVMINKFKGIPTYIYCDPNLPLRQLWPAIANKKWASNWKEDDIVIQKRVNVISQSTNIEEIDTAFSSVKIQNLTQYDFQKFPMMFERPEGNLFGREFDRDLSYGGTFRSGRREKKLIEFYFGHPEDLDVEVFGKIKLKDFNPKKIGDLRPPAFTGPVDYDNMLKKMYSSRAHIAIGDGHYPKFGMISQRVYESIMSDCLTFIDTDFDPTHRIFGNCSELTEICYIKNRKQVYDRLKHLSDPDIEYLAELQHKAVGFDREKYCNNFVHIVETYD